MTTMKAERERGQALVEFSIAITVFLMLLMAIFDFGRAIYIHNGLAQAAREVARSESVYDLEAGWSAQAQATIATQQALIPGLTILAPVCVTAGSADDSAGEARRCQESEYVVATARSTYTPVSLLGFLGTINLEAKSRTQIALSEAK